MFGMGRVFYNWTFIPYAMYSIVGCAMAYIYFNKKEELSVAASLTPLFGQRVKYGVLRSIIDVISIVALALGLSSNLGMGLALIGSGLEAAYGIKQGPVVWITLFQDLLCASCIPADRRTDGVHTEHDEYRYRILGRPLPLMGT